MTIMKAVEQPNAQDERDTSGVPFHLTDDAYIPSGRYISPEFAALENERLWPHAWQVAARADEIPRPGDFVEYKINQHSILVVRTDKGEVRAFHNACRHRATQLGRDCGSFPTGRIVCPFHGWQFDLEGKCTFVYAKQGFRPDVVDDGKTALKAVRCEAKWGLVWVNLDPAAPSLADYLGTLPDYVDPLRMDLMQVRWWKQIRLEANWKVAQEAFFEGYHIMQSHPEMALWADGDEFRMDVLDALNPRVIDHGRGHWAHNAHAFDPAAVPDDHDLHTSKTNAEVLLMRNRAMWLGANATMPEWVYDLQEDLLASGVPLDDNFGRVLMARVTEEAEARKIPLPAPDPKATSWAHVFPNLTFLSGYGGVLMYRSRPVPGDPNACIYDFWSLEIMPEGTELGRPTQCDDDFFQKMWVVQQDKGNIERQQIGLQTMGYTENRLATSYEKTISVFHRRLDQVLADGEG